MIERAFSEATAEALAALGLRFVHEVAGADLGSLSADALAEVRAVLADRGLALGVDAAAQPIDLDPLPVRVANVLQNAGVVTWGDLAACTDADLLRVSTSNRMVVGHVAMRMLLPLGWMLADDRVETGPWPIRSTSVVHPPPPVVDHDVWGSLYVHLADHRDADQVRRAVIEAYRAAGVGPVAQAVEAVEAVDEALSRPVAPADPAELGDDEVIVYHGPLACWVAVASARLAVAPVARHPLAVALSRSFDVLSVASVIDRYAEWTLYRDGAVAGTAVQGPVLPAHDPDAPPFDLGWFAGRGSVLGGEQLAEHLGDPRRLVMFAGPDTGGFAELAASAEDDLLVFRRVG